MENVLVAGATGGTGSEVMARLAGSTQYRAVAMVRRKEQAERLNARGIETVIGDLSADASHAPVGFDKVIFTAGSTGNDIHAIDQEGTKRFIDACKAARIRKFIMMSAMGAEDPYKHDVMRNYMLAKQNADTHLRASGLDYAICQPGYLNDGPARGRITLAPHLVTFANISRADVAETLVRCLPQQTALNRLFVIWEGDTPIQDALDSLATAR